MREKIYLYPIWVRIWHMLNLLLILTLVFSGLCLQYSWCNYLLISFNVVIFIHNLFGIILSAIFIFYLVGNHFTTNGVYYHSPDKGRMLRLLKQTRYYSYGIFKNENTPFPISKDRKFNPLQKFSYVFAMYFLIPVIIISGFGLLFPEILPNKVFNISGILITDIVHITSGFLLTIFIIVHIYFCTIGKTPLSNFNSMLTGWH